MSEVVIVGGGVIGLSLAYELSSHEIDVTILERSVLGKEDGGILVRCSLIHSPLMKYKKPMKCTIIETTI